MTRLSLLALTIAAIAAAPARASHMGEVSVSASVVYSARVLPAQVVSVRRLGAEGRGRMIASVRPGGRGPLLIEQRGGAVVQLASPATGARVGAAAISHFATVGLELGGKSPNIVFADAPLDAAIAGLLAGIFAIRATTVSMSWGRTVFDFLAGESSLRAAPASSSTSIALSGRKRSCMYLADNSAATRREGNR